MNENKKQIDTLQRVTNSTWIHLNETPFFNEKMMKRYEEIDVNVFLASLLRDFCTPSLPPQKNVTDPYYTTESFEGNARRGEEACSSFVPSRPQVPEFPPFAINKVGAHNAGRLHRTLLSFVSAFLLFLSLTFCRTR